MDNEIAVKQPLSHSLPARGFTLVELLAVLSVIAILTAAIVPAVGKVLHNARRAQSGAALRQIALAYASYQSEGGKARTLNATPVYDWAFAIAKDGGVNEATLYYNEEDPLVTASTATHPKVVAYSDGAGAWTLNPDFDGFPLSVTLVSGLSPDAPASTTPVAWTRGLKDDGTWRGAADATPGAWNDEGGYIAYADGHVEWYANLDGDDGNGALVNYVTKRPTKKISEAINSTAKVLEYK